MALPVGGGELVNSWTPGTTYPPGSVVRPTNTGLAGSTAIANGDFESALTSWTAATADWTTSIFAKYSGSLGAVLAAGVGSVDLTNNTEVAVVPGQTINAQVFFNTNANATGTATCQMGIKWYNASHVFISTSVGAIAPSGVVHTGPYFAKFQVRGIAPSGAAFAKFTGTCTNNGTNDLFLDTASWDYSPPASTTPQIFYAVQTGTGKSGTTEPVWATTPPDITDGTVTWSSQKPTSILWSAGAIMTSGLLQPTWPTVPGAIIRDGTIDWVAITPRIADTNCPQSKYVMTAASKIFAADTDIVRFSATTDPTDWTTEADAGFLPTGLQAYGKNPFVALGLYRSNGVFFNADGMQMWQLDEDPANMALLDSIPVGCTQSRSLAPVNNDLFFTAAQGDRTMGISAGSGNLQAGDVGMPVDLFVQAAVAAGITPIGTYYPSTGQRWLAFPGWNDSAYFVTPGSSTTTTILVYTMTRIGEVGAWSRYLLPVVVSDFAQMGDALYVRGTQVNGSQSIFKVDATQLTDSYADSVTATAFTGTIQWPWLDMGQPGQTKKLEAMDFVVTLGTAGTYTMQIGYDQTDATSAGFTAAFNLTTDTLPGLAYPMELSAPTFAVRLSLPSTIDWTVQEVGLYLNDTATGT